MKTRHATRRCNESADTGVLLTPFAAAKEAVTMRIAAVLLLLVVAGCANGRTAQQPPPPNNPYMARGQGAVPRLQRMETERFDPYPMTNVGPEVMGGRPQDFDKPRAEPTRGRWWQPSSFRRFFK